MTEFLRIMDEIFMIHEKKDEPRRPFCRIHAQYIIALNQIDYLSVDLSSVILRCEEELPISETYLPAFKKAAHFFV